jgi:hypothetical protein
MTLDFCPFLPAFRSTAQPVVSSSRMENPRHCLTWLLCSLSIDTIIPSFLLPFQCLWFFSVVSSLGGCAHKKVILPTVAISKDPVLHFSEYRIRAILLRVFNKVIVSCILIPWLKSYLVWRELHWGPFWSFEALGFRTLTSKTPISRILPVLKLFYYNRNLISTGFLKSFGDFII